MAEPDQYDFQAGWFRSDHAHHANERDIFEYGDDPLSLDDEHVLIIDNSSSFEEEETASREMLSDTVTQFAGEIDMTTLWQPSAFLSTPVSKSQKIMEDCRHARGRGCLSPSVYKTGSSRVLDLPSEVLLSDEHQMHRNPRPPNMSPEKRDTGQQESAPKTRMHKKSNKKQRVSHLQSQKPQRAPHQLTLSQQCSLPAAATPCKSSASAEDALQGEYLKTPDDYLDVNTPMQQPQKRRVMQPAAINRSLSQSAIIRIQNTAKIEQVLAHELAYSKCFATLSSNNKLPLVGIRRHMKQEKGISLVSSETPVILSKVCELFLKEACEAAVQYASSDEVTASDFARAFRLHPRFNFLTE